MSNNIEDLTIDEFIQCVGNKGYTFARAILSGGTKAENFVKQILLVLDFDNNLDINVFKQFCEEYRLPYLFTYRTLRWKPTENRFRAVFLMDHWIENPVFAKAVNCMLTAIFPDSDSSCVNINRLFYGGKGVMDINLNARVNIVDIARATESYYKWRKKDNYVRDLERLGKLAGINVEAGRLCIFDESEFTTAERDDVIIDNGVVMIPYKEGNKSYEKFVKGQKTVNLPLLTTYDVESLCWLCPLPLTSKIE